MHPKHISIQDFQYQLPDERIAKYPLANRDASRLLLYRNGEISDETFSHLARHLPANSLLVFNNSKVVEARILFQKPSGGIIEIFALEPHEKYPDIKSAMQVKASIQYKCLVGGAGKWKHGMVLNKNIVHNNIAVNITAKIVERRPDCFVIAFEWTPADTSFAEILHAMGQIPIPPYLHRDADETDAERYQTVYAKNDGSVAAPTAGLHFTPEVLQSLSEKNIQFDYVTLHVGAGTFMPVKAATMHGHDMHAEFIDIVPSLVQNLIFHKNIVAVGTTSMRTLESLYWMGLKTLLKPNISLKALAMQQWEVYDELMAQQADKQIVLQALLNWMESNNMDRLVIKTQILLAPGYTFKIVNGLITNFHQPQSTLLLLVSAFIGEDWKKVYEYALQHDFRFLSYGDSSLLFRAT